MLACSKLNLPPADQGAACHVPGVGSSRDKSRLPTSNKPVLLALRSCLHKVPVRGAAAALAARKEEALQLPLHPGHAQHSALHPVAHRRHLQAASAQAGVRRLEPGIIMNTTQPSSGTCRHARKGAAQPD